MKKLALILACSALGGLLVLAHPHAGDALPSAPKVETGQMLLVKDDKKKKKKEQSAKTCGKKVKCDVGEVRLEKENQNGACCEPKGGLAPAKTTEKCTFPGEVGEPPNCKCPEGTEFLGYKGCVRVQYNCVTANVVKKDGGYLGQGYDMTTFAPTENEARAEFFKRVDDYGWKVNATVNCKKVFPK